MNEKIIEIKCQAAVNIEISKFKELQGDLKVLSSVNYEKLKSSILKYGFSFPFIAWKDGKTYWIIDAHQRYKVLNDLITDGYTVPALPTVLIDAKDRREAKEKLLLLNSQYGTMTVDGFTGFINEPGFELDFSSFKDVLEFPTLDLDFESFGQEPPSATEDDYEIPDKIETDIKLGDLFQIGEHRLLCGDSTKKEDVERLMNGEKADLFLTDPPYGVSYSEKNRFLNTIALGHRIQEPIENDNLSTEDVAKIWGGAFENLGKLLNPINSVYIFSPQNRDLMMMMMMIEKGGIHISSVLIWLKNNHVLGMQDYALKHEPIIYGWLKSGTHKFYGGFKTSIIECDKPVSSKLHPTMKPIELLEELINNSSIKDNLILDLFLGSGSTMVAAHQLKRKCYGMEISPEYCQVIIDRMKKLDSTLEIKKL